MSYLDYTNLDLSCINNCGKIAYLNSWNKDKDALYNQIVYQNVIEDLDIYTELKSSKLKPFCALIIPMAVDQIWLYRNKELLEEFLEKGGVIFDFAASFCEYLPNLPLYMQSAVPIRQREVKITSHSICNGVREYDINYRHGVKGFFNRGFIKAPKNADIILKDSECECVAYIDKSSFNGILLSTAGADLMTLGMTLENDTSRRMGLNCLIWLENELRGRV